MNEDEALETLFSSAPEEFVGLRDRLARELRGQGQGAAAQALKGLRRPTLAAWALNQLARREPRALRALVATGDRLRAAAQAGGGAPLRAAHQAQREAIAGLTAAAGALLERSGHPATGEALRQIHATLEASAAVNAEDRERLLRGRLVAPLEPPSLLELLGSLGPVQPAAPAREAREGPARGPPERLERLPERRRRVDPRRDALQLQVERAEKEATAARGRAEQAEEHARRLDEAARRAEERAQAAREQAQQAAATAASARSQADKAREQARAARGELERISGGSPPAPAR